MAKAPADIRSLARSYAPEAIRTLAGIMQSCVDFPMARIAAANALLDRGFGKPVTDGEGREHINVTIRKILEIGPALAPQPQDKVKVIDHNPNEGEGNDDDTSSER